MTKEEFIRKMNDIADEIYPTQKDKSNDNQVEINGILWDRENTIVGDKEYFTWKESKQLAELAGKRLPTREEFQALAELGYTYDEDKDGFWLGHDHDKKEKSKRSIFMYLGGYRSSNSAVVYVVTSNGYWRSATPDPSSVYSYYPGIPGSGAVTPRNSTYRSRGLNVRCVAD